MRWAHWITVALFIMFGVGPALPPKLTSNYERVYLSFLPPLAFPGCGA